MKFTPLRKSLIHFEDFTLFTERSPFFTPYFLHCTGLSTAKSEKLNSLHISTIKSLSNYSLLSKFAVVVVVVVVVVFVCLFFVLFCFVFCLFVCFFFLCVCEI